MTNFQYKEVANTALLHVIISWVPSNSNSRWKCPRNNTPWIQQTHVFYMHFKSFHIFSVSRSTNALLCVRILDSVWFALNQAIENVTNRGVRWYKGHNERAPEPDDTWGLVPGQTNRITNPCFVPDLPEARAWISPHCLHWPNSKLSAAYFRAPAADRSPGAPGCRCLTSSLPPGSGKSSWSFWWNQFYFKCFAGVPGS